MMDALIKIFRFIWTQKFKILFTLGCALIFLFLLFPFKDLNDFVSGQVSRLTQNKVYLQFEDMHLNPVTASISMDQVKVETSEIDGLNIDSLSASPSLMALFKRQPGGKLIAEGFLGGSTEIKLTPLEKLDNGALKANVTLSSENISLKNMRETLKIAIPLNGSTKIDAVVTADMSFREQPDGEVVIVIDRFEMPPSMVNTPIGPLNLPEIKFNQIDVKGKLSNGKLQIESAKLGSSTDELSGTLKGDIDIRFENIGGQPRPRMGGYNLSVDLASKPAFQEKNRSLLGLIDQFRRDDKGVSRYSFKLQAANTDMPPSMLPLK